MTPARLAARARRIVVACGALVAGSCGAPLPVALQLSWRFADGRRCEDAGVSVVAVGPDGAGTLGCTPTTCIFVCQDGLAAAGVTLAVGAQGPPRIRLEARSPQADVLYRASLAVDGPAATAVLVYTGGQ